MVEERADRRARGAIEYAAAAHARNVADIHSLVAIAEAEKQSLISGAAARDALAADGVRDTARLRAEVEVLSSKLRAVEAAARAQSDSHSATVVSRLLYTVTFYANHAHNLTCSP